MTVTLKKTAHHCGQGTTEVFRKKDLGWVQFSRFLENIPESWTVNNYDKPCLHPGALLTSPSSPVFFPTGRGRHSLYSTIFMWTSFKKCFHSTDSFDRTSGCHIPLTVPRRYLKGELVGNATIRFKLASLQPRCRASPVWQAHRAVPHTTQWWQGLRLFSFKHFPRVLRYVLTGGQVTAPV